MAGAALLLRKSPPWFPLTLPGLQSLAGYAFGRVMGMALAGTWEEKAEVTNGKQHRLYLTYYNPDRQAPGAPGSGGVVLT